MTVALDPRAPAAGCSSGEKIVIWFSREGRDICGPICGIVVATSHIG